MSMTTTRDFSGTSPTIDPFSVAGPRRFTRAEYHRMAEFGIIKSSDRVELLDGVVYTMSPIGPGHAWAVKRLARLLNQKLDGPGWMISVQDPIVLGDLSEPEPDLVVLHAKNGFDMTRHPLASEVVLAIEVAETTLEKDLKIKQPLYAASGLAELWVVDLPGLCVYQCRRPVGGHYLDVTSFKPGEVLRLHLPDGTGTEIGVDEILGRTSLES